MCTSSFRGGAAALVIALVVAFASACDDPTAVRRAPPLSGMRLFMIVDPDEASQPLLVKPADEGGTLTNVRVEVRTAAGAFVPVTVLPPEFEGFELQPCIRRYGAIVGGNVPQCLDLDFRVDKGESYEVRVFADEHPTASARFTVPGAFSIEEVNAPGSPSIPREIDVRWTPSAGAYRYLVAIRPAVAPECVERGGCQRNWFAVTTATRVSTALPEGELDGARGPFYVDVYAVDQAIYQYLTSGVAENMFPVPPVQNVEGGRGAVGAWVRQSFQLP